MRQGERLPAPTSVDVNVRAGTVTLGSVPAEPEPLKVLPRCESLPRPVTADVMQADTGVVDAANAESQQQRVVPAGGENLTALAAADVADGETKKAGPAPWRPKVRSGPIWNER